MKFEVGKKYQVRLGSKHGRGTIVAIYKGEEPNAGMGDCHTIEMVEPIRCAKDIAQFNEFNKKEFGYGINYIVGGDQILKEVK